MHNCFEIIEQPRQVGLHELPFKMLIRKDAQLERR